MFLKSLKEGYSRLKQAHLTTLLLKFGRINLMTSRVISGVLAVYSTNYVL